MDGKITRRQCLKAGAVIAAAVPLCSWADKGSELSKWFTLPAGGIAAARTIQPAPVRLVENGRSKRGFLRNLRRR